MQLAKDITRTLDKILPSIFPRHRSAWVYCLAAKPLLDGLHLELNLWPAYTDHKQLDLPVWTINTMDISNLS